MQNPLNLIVHSVFGESRLEDVPLDALHLLTVKHPFSAPAHLLYARRLKDLGDSRYGEAVSIAALHYANPHWLQHQLSAPMDVEGYAIAAPSDSTVMLQEAEAENREMEALSPDEGDRVHDLTGADSFSDNAESDSQSETLSAEADTPIPDIHSESFEPEPTSDAEVTAEAAPMLPSEFSSSSPTEAESPVAVDNAFDNAESRVTPDVGSEPEEASAADPAIASDSGITTLYEGETTEASREVGDSELIHVTMPETGSADLQQAPADAEPSPTAEASPDVHPPAVEGHPLQPEAIESAPFSQEGTGGTPAEEVPVSEELTLPVEPLHLTDYLASQGIVVSTDLEPREDGKGERSFTGWLRTMKRFQPDRSAPVLSEDEEDVIRSEAEASNQDEDIVTEAMAEVYASQGLIRKAIDIYSKLCLLDPDRTSTFADRITQLKAFLT